MFTLVSSPKMFLVIISHLKDKSGVVLIKLLLISNLITAEHKSCFITINLCKLGQISLPFFSLYKCAKAR